MSFKEKNESISKAMKETLEKRKSQVCRVFKVKVDDSSLKSGQREALKMIFVEAKWMTNEAIGSPDIFSYRPGKTTVHKDKDGNDVTSELKYLGSQMKQSVYDELISNIRTLVSLKKEGFKVGRLKFKREVASINLKQYDVTYSIANKRKIKIQKVPGLIRINGLDQIFSKKNKLKYELANAKLLNTPRGYYVALTCYVNKKEDENRRKNKKNFQEPKGEVGIDLGISTAVTLSDGRKFNASVRESDHIRRLQRKLQRQMKGSKRRAKTTRLLRVEYQKLTDRKNDSANKIVAEIKKFKDVYMQDDCVNAWKVRFGKTVQHSVLGRVKQRIKPIAKNVLDRWTPTTKTCTNCGKIHSLTLADRVFSCECGVNEDRDVHAAKNMIVMSKIKVGQELPEFKLVETVSDSSQHMPVRAAVNEARKSQKEV